MQFVMTYEIREANVEAASNRFLQTEGAPPPDGVELLGRWHAVAGRRGWMLVASDDVEAMHRYARTWHDLLDLEITPVLDDPAIAKVMIDMANS